MIELWTEVLSIVISMKNAEYKDDCLYNLIGAVSELCELEFPCIFVIDAPVLLEMIFN